MAGVISFEDLSGSSADPKTDNPYDALIDACHDSPTEIQARYSLHRTTRNANQRTALLPPTSTSILREPILRKLLTPSEHPSFQDPRHCLVFWARPPPPIKALILTIQTRLRALAPHIWSMPQECLHMTTIELAHSRTADEIDALVEKIRPKLAEIVNFTRAHRARLVCPLLSYDATALALSFLPAAPATTASEDKEGNAESEADGGDRYTYHHLRRSLHALLSSTSVPIASRYVIPSAHISILRFVSSADHAVGGVDADGAPTDPGLMRRWVAEIESINQWLVREFWGEVGTGGRGGVEWVVGEGQGLDCRRGTVWYGGGETVAIGQGF